MKACPWTEGCICTLGADPAPEEHKYFNQALGTLYGVPLRTQEPGVLWIRLTHPWSAAGYDPHSVGAVVSLLRSITSEVIDGALVPLAT